MNKDMIIPEIEYKEYFDFLKEHKDELFINGFHIVQLKGFYVSPYDQEPCYIVLEYKYDANVGAYFYVSELPLTIAWLTPIENLSDYSRILEHWNMNLERMETKNDLN